MAQLPPATTAAPHVLVCAKSAALAPPMEMLEMFSVAPPTLVIVTVWGLLVVPVFWLANARLGVLRLRTGSEPPPSTGVAMSVWICAGVSVTL